MTWTSLDIIPGLILGKDQRWTVSKQESVHRVINRKSIGRAVNSAMHREIKSDAAYLANLAERLSRQSGLPLSLAHKRVTALAVSAGPRRSTSFFSDRGR
jgi:hypothetical protein